MAGTPVHPFSAREPTSSKVCWFEGKRTSSRQARVTYLLFTRLRDRVAKTPRVPPNGPSWSTVSQAGLGASQPSVQCARPKVDRGSPDRKAADENLDGSPSARAPQSC